MTSAASPTIRPARPADVPAVVAMVHEQLTAWVPYRLDGAALAALAAQAATPTQPAA